MSTEIMTTEISNLVVSKYLFCQKFRNEKETWSFLWFLAPACLHDFNHNGRTVSRCRHSVPTCNFGYHFFVRHVGVRNFCRVIYFPKQNSEAPDIWGVREHSFSNALRWHPSQGGGASVSGDVDFCFFRNFTNETKVGNFAHFVFVNKDVPGS